MKARYLFAWGMIAWGLAVVPAKSGTALVGTEFRLGTEGGRIYTAFGAFEVQRWFNRPAVMIYTETPLAQNIGLVSMFGFNYIAFPRPPYILADFHVVQAIASYDGTKWNMFGVGYTIGPHSPLGGGFYSFEGSQIIPPANDHFAQRIVLTGIPVQTAGNTELATKEPLEPDHAGAANSVESVWWTWTAPQSGWVQINTFDSFRANVLAVYTGSSLGALTEVAADQHSRPGLESLVRFEAQAGTSYQIAVSGTPSTHRSIRDTMLNISSGPPAPVNDAFADRIVVSGLPSQLTGTNEGAYFDPGEPGHQEFQPPYSSVWWSWTPPHTGCFEVNTIGSQIDTALAVYTGSSLETLSLVARDTDSVKLVQSRVRFEAQAGTAYQIAIDGYFAQEGPIALNFLECPPPPPNDNFADREQILGFPATVNGNTAGGTSEPNELNHVSSPGRTIWWSWTAPSSGQVIVETTAGTHARAVLAVYTGTDLDTLSWIAWNLSCVGECQVSIPAIMGTTYQIVVGTRSWAGSPFGEEEVQVDIYSP